MKAPGSAVVAASLRRHRLCDGRVWHVRRIPFRHAFDYRVQLLELDLEDLDAAFAGQPLWSLDRPNVASFHRRDHLDGSADLAGAARAAVSQRLGFEPRGPVHLLAYPRYFGYAFNPVTFYLFYAHGVEHPWRGAAAGAPVDQDGGRLQAILLEVANTPWNERHLYALDCRERLPPYDFEIDKDFHVSPFLPMDMRYRFRFDIDAESFRVLKLNLQDDRVHFAARLELRRRPLTRTALAGALLRFPPMTFRVIGAIYWQALKLWLRGARYHPKPPLNNEGKR